MREFILSALLLLPAVSNADTKRLECDLTTEAGVQQKIIAIIDDSSTKAEVQIFALTAECAASNSCAVRLFQKTVLPSAIRLQEVNRVGSILTHTTDISVDRQTLQVTFLSLLQSSEKDVEQRSSGQCALSAVQGKNLL